MKFLFALISISTLCAVGISAQVSPSAALPESAVKTNAVGRTYVNEEFRFKIDFPEPWSVDVHTPSADSAGTDGDLTLRAPASIGRASRVQLEKALERVEILATATGKIGGAKQSATFRIALEDIRPVPAVKDAVDYFDLMRSQYAAMKLPPDFRYSTTNAEQLGSRQFAFIDTDSLAGKKRLYATVRNGFALVFTLSYTNPGELKAMRDILAAADFKYSK